ncbi:LETM1 domain-containing protein [bacterium]|nr:LETM1 domain-containing protein [bacterium]
MQKHLKGEKLTKEENNAIKEQFYDVLKSAGIIIPFAVIPGASLLIPILMKLCKVFNIPFENMLPSSFQIHDKIKKDIDKIDENTIV